MMKSVKIIAAGLSMVLAAVGGTRDMAQETYLNIRSFGAKGDGKTDDTPALNAAMKAAADGNGVVYFPAGTYMIHPVKVPSHIALKGDSNWAYENKTGNDPDFEGRTTLKALSGNARALLDCHDSRGTRIIGLTLDGNRQGEAMHGIYARHTGCELHLVVEDCRINHFTGAGIRLEKAWVFAIRRCLIMWNGQHGIDCTGGYDGWVMDTMLTANTGAGFYACGEAPEGLSEQEKKEIGFFGCASVALTANRIEWNTEGGIMISNSNSMQVNGCSIDHNFGPGIKMIHSIANTITGCKIRTNGVDAEGLNSSQIWLEDAQGAVVTGNNLWGWFGRKEHDYKDADPKYGMIVKNLSGSVIANNAMFESSSLAGIHDLGGHDDATAIKNNAYVKPQVGLKKK
ncbi:right-handed parallel beta-helix repeat-containing protein [Pontiella agarivorans]|uniref:Glycosyl hydrolase family 28-related protein n=1 Tax=Pontiella agarivorans TaxID=3038953 RepID=A0ABU5MTU7_9BACT|nr:glycosyl hydrolase family 28-related protein [Pontiella agarivorans]MDZ8117553.1 glycosyl hydrolase family 28-related protein [Pontiella agarivorans]